LRAASLTAALVALTLTGCALRLGGRAPVDYRVVALLAGPDAAPDDAARVIGRFDPGVVLLGTPDSPEWTMSLAGATGLRRSGPALGELGGVALLAWEPLGDTTVALPLERGDSLRVQDALYEAERGHRLDVLAVRVPPRADPRDAARTLLAYVATDVSHDVPVLLGVVGEGAAQADSVADLLRPVFAGPEECVQRAGFDADGTASGPPRTGAAIRLLYGPSTRVVCRAIRALDSAGDALVAEVTLR